MRSLRRFMTTTYTAAAWTLARISNVELALASVNIGMAVMLEGRDVFRFVGRTTARLAAFRLNTGQDALMQL